MLLCMQRISPLDFVHVCTGQHTLYIRYLTYGGSRLRASCYWGSLFRVATARSCLWRVACAVCSVAGLCSLTAVCEAGLLKKHMDVLGPSMVSRVGRRIPVGRCQAKSVPLLLFSFAHNLAVEDRRVAVVKPGAFVVRGGFTGHAC